MDDHDRDAELTVVDLLRLRPGREAELAQTLARLVRAEFAAAQPHGALRFALRREEAGERFMLEEQWRSRAAFETFHAHHRPHELLAFLERAGDLLAEPVERSVSFWTSFDGAGDARA